MASERISLIKIQPKRIIPNRYITLVSGLDYTTEFCPAYPDEVYQGQTPITFSYDRKTKVLSFTANSAVDDDIFIEYTLRFCSGQATYRQKNDGTSANPKLYQTNDVEYLPRLRSHPRTIFKANDSFVGVVSVDTTSIVLVNDDLALNKYLTKFDMYLERPFSSYVSYDYNGGKLEKLGSGVISSIKFGRSVNLSVKNEINKLNTPATMGNADIHCSFSEENYPSGDPESWGNKIPFVTSNRSGHYTSAMSIEGASVKLSDVGGFQKGYRYNSLANNDYILCVAHDPEPLTPVSYNLTYVSSFTQNGLYLVRYSLVGGSFLKGSWVGVYDANAMVNTRAFVYSISGSSIYFSVGGPGAGVYYTKILVPPIYVKFSERAGSAYEAGYIQPMYANGVLLANDYYITYETTAQGDKLIKMIANSATVEDIDFEVEWYMHTSQGSLSLGEATDRIAADVGYSGSNFSGFITAPSYADVINMDGESDSYHDVISRISQSMYASVTIDNLGRLLNTAISLKTEAEIQALIPLSPVFTPTHILGDVKANLNYNDIYNKVTFSDRLSGVNLSESNDLLSDLGVNPKEYSFTDGVIGEAGIAVEIVRALDVLTYPVVTYQFSIDTEAWFSIAGTKPVVGKYIMLDDMGGRLMGGDDSALVRIIGFELAADKIKVVAYDVQKIS